MVYAGPYFFLYNNKMKNKLAYLATPYSDNNPEIMEERFLKVNKVASILISNGEIIFSPISHTHPIKLAGNLPGTWQFWDEFDRTYLERCYRLYVLMIDGWEKSTGVNAEIKIAKELGLEIIYINYEEIVNA